MERALAASKSPAATARAQATAASRAGEGLGAGREVATGAPPPTAGFVPESSQAAPASAIAISAPKTLQRPLIGILLTNTPTSPAAVGRATATRARPGAEREFRFRLYPSTGLSDSPGTLVLRRRA